MFKYLKKKYVQFFVCKHKYKKVKTIPTFDKTSIVVINGKSVLTFTAFDKFKCKKCKRIKYGEYYMTDNCQ